MTNSENFDLIEFLKTQEYFDLKELEDGTIIGKGGLAFTTAIYIGLDKWGWEKRFCFDNRAVLDEEFNKLKTNDDEPAGYIARRHG